MAGSRADPGGVAAGAIEARDEAGTDRVGAKVEDDGGGCGGRFGGERGGITSDRADHGDIAAHQIGSQRGQAAVVAARPAELDRDVLAFDEAALFEGMTIHLDQMCRFLRRPCTQETDHGDRLLRTHNERPRSRRAEKSEELAPF